MVQLICKGGTAGTRFEIYHIGYCNESRKKKKQQIQEVWIELLFENVVFLFKKNTFGEIFS
jgi:hypothetical protein